MNVIGRYTRHWSSVCLVQREMSLKCTLLKGGAGAGAVNILRDLLSPQRLQGASRSKSLTMTHFFFSFQSEDCDFLWLGMRLVTIPPSSLIITVAYEAYHSHLLLLQSTAACNWAAFPDWQKNPHLCESAG